MRRAAPRPEPLISAVTRSATRRGLLKCALAVGAAACLGRAGQAAAGVAQGPGLHSLAARKGLFFGCAIEGYRMAGDPDYGAIVARECGVATPEGAMQWKSLQPEPGAFDFERMDGARDWGRRHGFPLRGHAMLWHEGAPQWFAQEFAAPADWDRLVVPYAEAAGSRYARDLIHWDVLNEALDPADGRADGLRDWALARALGEDYVRLAFELAGRAAPGVRLYYNDYGFEYGDRQGRRARANLLAALERWLKAGVPIDGVGMQSHLETRRGLGDDAAGLRRFLADIAAFDLDIVISELDVREHEFAAGRARRDELVADEVRRYLDIALDEPAVRGVVTWGLSDRHSWLDWFHDERNRGLPYDAGLAAKPMRTAIAAAFEGAPDRL